MRAPVFVVLLCLLIATLATSSLAAYYGICLSREPAPPEVVYNDGTGTITFKWEVTYQTGCVSPGLTLDVEPLSVGSGVNLFSLPCSPSPWMGSHTWMVPAGTQPGNYYGKLSFFSDWGCPPPGPRTMEDEARVAFIIAGAGRFKICKFNDVDGSGSLTAPDTWLPNWEFKIERPKGNVVATVYTGPDGCTEDIVLPMVPCDATTTTYYIREVLPTTGCWVQTVPAIECYELVLGQGPKAEPVRFGNWQPAKFRFFKYNDFDGDCVFDPGEEKLEGWKFKISGPYGAAATLETGPDGYTPYFTGPVGHYTVEECAPEGFPECWESCRENPFGIDVVACTNPDIKVGNRFTANVTLKKFHDYDGDGIWDGDEPPIEGWRFDIKGPDGVVQTVFTNSSGIAKVKLGTHAPPATTQYEILEEEPIGWERTTPDVNPVITDLAACDCKTFIFGNRFPRVIVCKFNDCNSNGVCDPEEPCLPGWEFCVTRPDGTQVCVVSGTDGECPVICGPEGNYTIREVDQPGWQKTTPQGSLNPFCVCCTCPDVTRVIVGNCCPGEATERRCFLPVTLTQQDWRNLADPFTPGIPNGMLYTKFAIAFKLFTHYGTAYDRTIVAGKTKTIKFVGTTSSLTRLAYFFPQNGPPDKLKYDYSDPATTTAGVLAGEVLALTLNVGYNDMRVMPRTPGVDLEKYIVKYGFFKGRTVGEVLDIAHRVLGGDPLSWYGIPNYDTLVETLQAINANYQMSDINTFNDRGYLVPNEPPTQASPMPHAPHVP